MRRSTMLAISSSSNSAVMLRRPAIALMRYRSSLVRMAVVRSSPGNYTRQIRASMNKWQ